MVSCANGRWTQQHTQDDDRGAGAQAAYRPLAPRHDGRGATGCRPPSGVMSDKTEKKQQQATPLSAPCWVLLSTIRGGGAPSCLRGSQAAVKNGPAAPELRRRC